MLEKFGDVKLIFNPKDYRGFPQQRRAEQPISPYLQLRWAARNALHQQAGIRSNPGWTDQDIVDSVRAKVGLPTSEPFHNSFESYRDHLINTLQVAGVEIKEPITEVTHIIETLKTLFSK